MKLTFVLIPVVLMASAFGQTYNIDTFAGGALVPTPAPAVSSPVYAKSIVLDPFSNIYILTTSAVYKVDLSGTLTRIAGSPGGAATLGDNGPALSANICSSRGSMAMDSTGNIYVAETENHRIRKITTAGSISTIAGTGQPGFSGDNGSALNAQLNGPAGVVVDPLGNIYVADTNNNRVRKVSTTGTITTVAGTGTAGFGGDNGMATNAPLNNPYRVTLDSNRNLYIADRSNYRIRKVSTSGVITTYAGNGQPGYAGDGGPATGAKIYSPMGLAFDLWGNLYIADDNNYRIRKVNTSGYISTVAGNGTLGFSGDGGSALSAQLSYLNGVVVDSSGVIYIADGGNKRVRQVGLNGIITTVAGNGTQFGGDGGPATSALLYNTYDAHEDAAGNVYIVDYGNTRIRKVAPNGTITTFAGAGTIGSAGDGGPAVNAQLNGPLAMAFDSNGNVYIADYANHKVRKVTPGGTISTFAGTGIAGFSGDGGQAASARLNYPMGIAVDAADIVYIADSYNYRIRKVTTGGVISTVVGTGTSGYSGDGGQAASAKITSARGLAFDASDNLYFADTYNNCVRRVTPEGVISNVAGSCGTPAAFGGDGGPATIASLYNPVDVALDGNGSLLIADSGNYRIRRVAGGKISTVAGTGVTGYLGDGGAATSAKLFAPNSITVGPSGKVYITDTLAYAVRVLSPAFGVSAGGVVNAANYSTPVAPGSIVAMFGNYQLTNNYPVSAFPLPTNLGGVSFQFGSAPLTPLFFAGTAQANGQIPWELAGQSQTTIVASNSTTNGAPQTVNLATYAPAIFTTNAQGTGQGSILNLSNQLVDASHAAVAGADYVQIYCTGMGPVTNRPATGAPAPYGPLAETTTQPVVMIGGAQAFVSFSGLTPGTAGLYQVNALVPAGSAKGNAVPLTIGIGGATSNTVTIAVQ